MSRIRIIGLAFVAALAMSVVASSSASAFTLFLSHPANQMVTAGQDGKHKFTVEGKNVECEKAVFLGNAPGLEFTSFKTTADYKECTALGFAESIVHMNQCEYVLHASGLVDITCPTGKLIEILVNNLSGCAIHVHPQTGLEKVTYNNIAVGKNGRMVVEVNIKVENILALSNGKGIGCPKAGDQKAKYEGKSLAEGETGNLLVE